MSDELKPCPFCGSRSISMTKAVGGFQLWCYGCDACHAMSAYEGSETAALHAWNRRPTPEQSSEAREQLESARRVLKVLDDEASKRRQKYGSAIYSARDVDPDVYDIAKRIIDRAAMDRSALGREA